MPNLGKEISDFMNACDELTNDKFTRADINIKQVLETIAASEELTALFKNATEEFSYGKAKEVYMAPSFDGSTNKRVLLIPEDYNEQLAFIFCLFVDFARRDIDFTSFLLEFYYVDGSFTESYAAFVNQVVKPFKNAVKLALRQRNITVNQAPVGSKDRMALIKELRAAVVRLRKSVTRLELEEDDRYEIVTILNALCDCISHSDFKNFRPLLFGYEYAERALELETEELRKIFELTAELKL